MHDPRHEPGLGLIYVADATPGRHNPANCFIPLVDLDMGHPGFGKQTEVQAGKGRLMKTLGNHWNALQASGGCQFGLLSTTFSFLHETLNAVTGNDYSHEEVLRCGERIANIRQAFNVREGVNLVASEYPLRAYGFPPLGAGPNAGITVDLKLMLDEYLEEMDWSRDTAVPSERRLRELGLDFLVESIYSAH
jgi:aldehyde:ferredoxin oxidoreductase